MIMMRLVSRCRLTAPWPATKGRRRFTASCALMYLRLTIWVTNSSPGRDGSTSVPTTVRMDVWGAPSRGMMRYTFPDFTAVRPLTSRMVRRTLNTSSLAMRPMVCTVTLRPREAGAST